MPLPDSARREIVRIVGPENVREGDAMFALAGRTPSAVLFPASLDEAAACAGFCARHDLAVVPWGGGTRMAFGSPPSRFDVALSTARMDRLIAYEPADMTVTVEAGMTLDRLQEILGASGQFLPLDPPRPDAATLGGIVAARDTGALRHAHGTPRDLLIGLRVADPEGRTVRGGSNVVKNVAGYDLPKLYAGSWGTLGLLAELTFRVVPRPETTATVLVSVPSPAAAEAILASALDSDLVLSFVDLLNDRARSVVAPPSVPGWILIVGIDGVREDVDWEIDHLGAICRAAEASFVEVPAGGAAIRTAIAEFPLMAPLRPTVRIAVPSSRVAGAAISVETTAAEHDHSAAILAHAGVGLLIAHLDGPDEGRAVALLRALRARVAEAGGRMTLERAWPSLAEAVGPWPDAGDGLPLMEEIRRSLDPKRLWNPGRFVVR